MNKYIKTTVIILLLAASFPAQNKTGVQIARLKYSGGGDWYNDPSAEVNLLKFVGENTTIKVNAEYVFIDVSSEDIFNYPILFITGHGNIVFSEEERARLRKYLEKGGFVYIDDDYGLNNAVNREFKKIFPTKTFTELPFDYGIYNAVYNFEYGPPKTHEHDNKPPQGFGLFIGPRLVVYYTYESNPSDGWADKEAHNNTESVREEALKFGTNIIVFALTQ